MNEEEILNNLNYNKFLSKTKTCIQEFADKQKKICLTEFYGNIVTNKQDLVKLYVERDIELNIDCKEQINFAIQKLYTSPYSNRMATLYFIEDIIYYYRFSSTNINEKIILNEILSLQEMEYNNILFVNSKYSKQKKDRYEYIIVHIDKFYESSDLFYNELTFGELLVLGY